MKLKELFGYIIRKNSKVESKLIKPIRLEDCIQSIEVTFEGKKIDIVFNFYTLDVLNPNDIPRELSRKLFEMIEDNEPIRNSIRVERRAFCNFLLLKFGENHDTVLFLDRESPDYILYDMSFEYSYEVVEAINVKEAQFNTMCRKNTGRGRTKEEYKKYVNKKHKQYGDDFHIEEYKGSIILSPFENLVDTCNTRTQIVDAITKKVRKYKKYKINSNEKNILVRFSSLGFDNEFDFKQVGEMISDIQEIYKSDIDKIFVVSGMHGTLVEYNSAGDLIDFTVENYL